MSSTNSYGGVTTYDYDANNNVVQTTAPLPSGAVNPLVVTAVYDNAHNVTSVTDGTSSSIMSYSPLGLLTSLTANPGSENYVTSETYNDSNNSVDWATGQDPFQALFGANV